MIYNYIEIYIKETILCEFFIVKSQMSNVNRVMAQVCICQVLSIALGRSLKYLDMLEMSCNAYTVQCLIAPEAVSSGSNTSLSLTHTHIYTAILSTLVEKLQ